MVIVDRLYLIGKDFLNCLFSLLKLILTAPVASSDDSEALRDSAELHFSKIS